MSKNEAQTWRELIDPTLREAGWRREREVVIGTGRVNLKGGTMYDPAQRVVADYLLKRGELPLAVLEAKRESEDAVDGTPVFIVRSERSVCLTDRSKIPLDEYRRKEFAHNFGGVHHDVVEMLNSSVANRATQEARELMESDPPLPSEAPRLREEEFSRFSTAPELERGEVPAVDGKPVLPIQKFSAGQALCVGIGSLSHRRPIFDTMHYWSSRALSDTAHSVDDPLAVQERGLFSISQTAYLCYSEDQLALEIDETIVFLDGTLVYEWLVATDEGVMQYERLFESGKRCPGVIKFLRDNVVFNTFARALREGEIYIIETMRDHLDESYAPNRNRGEAAQRFTLGRFYREYTPHILRGIFRPRNKVFGFEVHTDHLEDMLRIMAADCQMNSVGHEIPFLLNRVDEEVRHRFKPHILKDRIAFEMATESKKIFKRPTSASIVRCPSVTMPN